MSTSSEKTPLVDRLANALLYEGYLLYPYRPAVKNTRRWTFGGLYPREWSELLKGTEPCTYETQCLLVGPPRARLQVSVRFLHLMERRQRDPSSDPAETAGAPIWQEAVERRIDLEPIRIAEMLVAPCKHRFAIDDDALQSVKNYRQEALEGVVRLSAQRLAADTFRVAVRIANETPLPRETGADHSVESPDPAKNREAANEALLRSFASTHAILSARDGAFVSLIDPPADRVEAANQCHNDKLWPVLVGETGQQDTLLCSPIILYDYPQIAPESPGDLFDATEIDEILTLRIMTLTDDEKREIAALDERGRALLERTQALAERQLADLHGTIRSLRPLGESSRVE